MPGFGSSDKRGLGRGVGRELDASPGDWQVAGVEFFVARANKRTLPITCVTADGLDEVLSELPSGARHWVGHHRYRGKPGAHLLVPGEDGAPGRVLVGIADEPSPWSFASLARLPAGRYAFDATLPDDQREVAALGFGLGGYRFDRYRSFDDERPALVWPTGCDRDEVTRLLEGQFLGRDLINTPAEDMGPSQLAEEARKLARRHGARCTVITGDKLLEKNFPTIHTVGRAAADAPRLIDIRWGRPSDPKVTLVGKGVCFDSGGLDLKPASAMLMMKKDMGGAAIALATAHAIMSANVKVRLRVLVPAVENAVSGNAFRPLDVIRTRKGVTVEVGNTDAEGRLILCDALAEASSEHPDLILDFATLTGSARIALGTELPALFTTTDALADDMIRAGNELADPYWRMPLHRAYRKQLDSKVADISNVGGSYGGAITAALFLHTFVDGSIEWGHVDVMAWNLSDQAGRPTGGEPMGFRAAYRAVRSRYGVRTARS